ncbi:microtubule-associated protein futsch-like isoform X2 [Littorina saxatilis]|uniref:microtubule-associated protein futsch-like isoform X2 n=1 Tax=Littorina saxatilis TaxID=31220 RepID=UPI0038B548ED
MGGFQDSLNDGTGDMSLDEKDGASGAQTEQSRSELRQESKLDTYFTNPEYVEESEESSMSRTAATGSASQVNSLSFDDNFSDYFSADTTNVHATDRDGLDRNQAQTDSSVFEAEGEDCTPTAPDSSRFSMERGESFEVSKPKSLRRQNRQGFTVGAGGFQTSFHSPLHEDDASTVEIQEGDASVVETHCTSTGETVSECVDLSGDYSTVAAKEQTSDTDAVERNESQNDSGTHNDEEVESTEVDSSDRNQPQTDSPVFEAVGEDTTSAASVSRRFSMERGESFEVSKPKSLRGQNRQGFTVGAGGFQTSFHSPLHEDDASTVEIQEGDASVVETHCTSTNETVSECVDQSDDYSTDAAKEQTPDTDAVERNESQKDSGCQDGEEIETTNADSSDRNQPQTDSLVFEGEGEDYSSVTPMSRRFSMERGESFEVSKPKSLNHQNRYGFTVGAGGFQTSFHSLLHEDNASTVDEDSTSTSETVSQSVDPEPYTLTEDVATTAADVISSSASHVEESAMIEQRPDSAASSNVDAAESADDNRDDFSSEGDDTNVDNEPWAEGERAENTEDSGRGAIQASVKSDSFEFVEADRFLSAPARKSVSHDYQDEKDSEIIDEEWEIVDKDIEPADSEETASFTVAVTEGQEGETTYHASESSATPDTVDDETDNADAITEELVKEISGYVHERPVSPDTTDEREAEERDRQVTDLDAESDSTDEITEEQIQDSSLTENQENDHVVDEDGTPESGRQALDCDQRALQSPHVVEDDIEEEAYHVSEDNASRLHAERGLSFDSIPLTPESDAEHLPPVGAAHHELATASKRLQSLPSVDRGESYEVADPPKLRRQAPQGFYVGAGGFQTSLLTSLNDEEDVSAQEQCEQQRSGDQHQSSDINDLTSSVPNNEDSAHWPEESAKPDEIFSSVDTEQTWISDREENRRASLSDAATEQSDTKEDDRDSQEDSYVSSFLPNTAEEIQSEVTDEVQQEKINVLKSTPPEDTYKDQDELSETSITEQGQEEVNEEEAILDEVTSQEQFASNVEDEATPTSDMQTFEEDTVPGEESSFSVPLTSAPSMERGESFEVIKPKSLRHQQGIGFSVGAGGFQTSFHSILPEDPKEDKSTDGNSSVEGDETEEETNPTLQTTLDDCVSEEQDRELTEEAYWDYDTENQAADPVTLSPDEPTTPQQQSGDEPRTTSSETDSTSTDQGQGPSADQRPTFERFNSIERAYGELRKDIFVPEKKNRNPFLDSTEAEDLEMPQTTQEDVFTSDQVVTEKSTANPFLHDALDDAPEDAHTQADSPATRHAWSKERSNTNPFVEDIEGEEGSDNTKDKEEKPDSFDAFLREVVKNAPEEQTATDDQGLSNEESSDIGQNPNFDLELRRSLFKSRGLANPTESGDSDKSSQFTNVTSTSSYTSGLTSTEEENGIFSPGNPFTVADETAEADGSTTYRSFGFPGDDSPVVEEAVPFGSADHLKRDDEDEQVFGEGSEHGVNDTEAFFPPARFTDNAETTRMQRISSISSSNFSESVSFDTFEDAFLSAMKSPSLDSSVHCLRDELESAAAGKQVRSDSSEDNEEADQSILNLDPPALREEQSVQKEDTNERDDEYTRSYSPEQNVQLSHTISEIKSSTLSETQPPQKDDANDNDKYPFEVETESHINVEIEPETLLAHDPANKRCSSYSVSPDEDDSGDEYDSHQEMNATTWDRAYLTRYQSFGDSGQISTAEGHWSSLDSPNTDVKTPESPTRPAILQSPKGPNSQETFDYEQAWSDKVTAADEENEAQPRIWKTQKGLGYTVNQRADLGDEDENKPDDKDEDKDSDSDGSLTQGEYVLQNSGETGTTPRDRGDDFTEKWHVEMQQASSLKSSLPRSFEEQKAAEFAEETTLAAIKRSPDQILDSSEADLFNEEKLPLTSKTTPDPDDPWSAFDARSKEATASPCTAEVLRPTLYRANSLPAQRPRSFSGDGKGLRRHPYRKQLSLTMSPSPDEEAFKIMQTLSELTKWWDNENAEEEAGKVDSPGFVGEDPLKMSYTSKVVSFSRENSKDLDAVYEDELDDDAYEEKEEQGDPAAPQTQGSDFADHQSPPVASTENDDSRVNSNNTEQGSTSWMEKAVTAAKDAYDSLGRKLKRKKKKGKENKNDREEEGETEEEDENSSEADSAGSMDEETEDETKVERANEMPVAPVDQLRASLDTQDQASSNVSQEPSSSDVVYSASEFRDDQERLSSQNAITLNLVPQPSQLSSQTDQGSPPLLYTSTSLHQEKGVESENVAGADDLQPLHFAQNFERSEDQQSTDDNWNFTEAKSSTLQAGPEQWSSEQRGFVSSLEETSATRADMFSTETNTEGATVGSEISPEMGKDGELVSPVLTAVPHNSLAESDTMADPERQSGELGSEDGGRIEDADIEDGDNACDEDVFTASTDALIDSASDKHSSASAGSTSSTSSSSDTRPVSRSDVFVGEEWGVDTDKKPREGSVEISEDFMNSNLVFTNSSVIEEGYDGFIPSKDDKTRTRSYQRSIHERTDSVSTSEADEDTQERVYRRQGQAKPRSPRSLVLITDSLKDYEADDDTCSEHTTPVIERKPLPASDNVTGDKETDELEQSAEYAVDEKYEMEVAQDAQIQSVARDLVSSVIASAATEMKESVDAREIIESTQEQQDHDSIPLQSKIFDRRAAAEDLVSAETHQRSYSEFVKESPDAAHVAQPDLNTKETSVFSPDAKPVERKPISLSSTEESFEEPRVSLGQSDIEDLSIFTDSEDRQWSDRDSRRSSREMMRSALSASSLKEGVESDYTQSSATKTDWLGGHKRPVTFSQKLARVDRESDNKDLSPQWSDISPVRADRVSSPRSPYAQYSRQISGGMNIGVNPSLSRSIDSLTLVNFEDQAAAEMELAGQYGYNSSMDETDNPFSPTSTDQISPISPMAASSFRTSSKYHREDVLSISSFHVVPSPQASTDDVLFSPSQLKSPGERDGRSFDVFASPQISSDIVQQVNKTSKDWVHSPSDDKAGDDRESGIAEQLEHSGESAAETTRERLQGIAGTQAEEEDNETSEQNRVEQEQEVQETLDADDSLFTETYSGQVHTMTRSQLQRTAALTSNSEVPRTPTIEEVPADSEDVDAKNLAETNEVITTGLTDDRDFGDTDGTAEEDEEAEEETIKKDRSETTQRFLEASGGISAQLPESAESEWISGSPYQLHQEIMSQNMEAPDLSPVSPSEESRGLDCQSPVDDRETSEILVAAADKVSSQQDTENFAPGGTDFAETEINGTEQTAPESSHVSEVTEDESRKSPSLMERAVATAKDAYTSLEKKLRRQKRKGVDGDSKGDADAEHGEDDSEEEGEFTDTDSEEEIEEKEDTDRQEGLVKESNLNLAALPQKHVETTTASFSGETDEVEGTQESIHSSDALQRTLTDTDLDTQAITAAKTFTTMSSSEAVGETLSSPLGVEVTREEENVGDKEGAESTEAHSFSAEDAARTLASSPQHMLQTAEPGWIQKSVAQTSNQLFSSQEFLATDKQREEEPSTETNGDDFADTALNEVAHDMSAVTSADELAGRSGESDKPTDEEHLAETSDQHERMDNADEDRDTREVQLLTERLDLYAVNQGDAQDTINEEDDDGKSEEGEPSNLLPDEEQSIRSEIEEAAMESTEGADSRNEEEEWRSLRGKLFAELSDRVSLVQGERQDSKSEEEDRRSTEDEENESSYSWHGEEEFHKTAAKKTSAPSTSYRDTYLSALAEKEEDVERQDDTEKPASSLPSPSSEDSQRTMEEQDASEDIYRDTYFSALAEKGASVCAAGPLQIESLVSNQDYQNIGQSAGDRELTDTEPVKQEEEEGEKQASQAECLEEADQDKQAVVDSLEDEDDREITKAENHTLHSTPAGLSLGTDEKDVRHVVDTDSLERPEDERQRMDLDSLEQADEIKGKIELESLEQADQIKDEIEPDSMEKTDEKQTTETAGETDYNDDVVNAVLDADRRLSKSFSTDRSSQADSSEAGEENVYDEEDLQEVFDDMAEEASQYLSSAEDKAPQSNAEGSLHRTEEFADFARVSLSPDFPSQEIPQDEDKQSPVNFVQDVRRESFAGTLEVENRAMYDDNEKATGSDEELDFTADSSDDDEETFISTPEAEFAERETEAGETAESATDQGLAAYLSEETESTAISGTEAEIEKQTEHEHVPETAENPEFVVNATEDEETMKDSVYSSELEEKLLESTTATLAHSELPETFAGGYSLEEETQEERLQTELPEAIVADHRSENEQRLLESKTDMLQLSETSETAHVNYSSEHQQKLIESSTATLTPSQQPGTVRAGFADISDADKMAAGDILDTTESTERVHQQEENDEYFVQKEEIGLCYANNYGASKTSLPSQNTEGSLEEQGENIDPEKDKAEEETTETGQDQTPVDDRSSPSWMDKAVTAAKDAYGSLGRKLRRKKKKTGDGDAEEENNAEGSVDEDEYTDTEGESEDETTEQEYAEVADSSTSTKESVLPEVHPDVNLSEELKSAEEGRQNVDLLTTEEENQCALSPEEFVDALISHQRDSATQLFTSEDEDEESHQQDADSTAEASNQDSTEALQEQKELGDDGVMFSQQQNFPAQHLGSEASQHSLKADAEETAEFGYKYSSESKQGREVGDADVFTLQQANSAAQHFSSEDDRRTLQRNEDATAEFSPAYFSAIAQGELDESDSNRLEQKSPDIQQFSVDAERRVIQGGEEESTIEARTDQWSESYGSLLSEGAVLLQQQQSPDDYSEHTEEATAEDEQTLGERIAGFTTETCDEYSSESQAEEIREESDLLQRKQSPTIPQFSTESEQGSLEENAAVTETTPQYSSESWQGQALTENATGVLRERGSDSEVMNAEEEGQFLPEDANQTAEATAYSEAEELRYSEEGEEAAGESDTKPFTSEDGSQPLGEDGSHSWEVERHPYSSEISEEMMISETVTQSLKSASSAAQPQSNENVTDLQQEIGRASLGEDGDDKHPYSSETSSEAMSMISGNDTHNLQAASLAAQYPSSEATSNLYEELSRASQPHSGEDERHMQNGDEESTVESSQLYPTDSWQGDEINESTRFRLQEAIPSSQSSEDEKRFLPGDEDSTVESGDHYTSESRQDDEFHEGASLHLQAVSSSLQPQSSEDEERFLPGDEDSTVESGDHYTSESRQDDEFHEGASLHLQAVSSSPQPQSSEDEKRFLPGDEDSTVESGDHYTSESRQDDEIHGGAYLHLQAVSSSPQPQSSEDASSSLQDNADSTVEVSNQYTTASWQDDEISKNPSIDLQAASPVSQQFSSEGESNTLDKSEEPTAEVSDQYPAESRQDSASRDGTMLHLQDHFVVSPCLSSEDGNRLLTGDEDTTVEVNNQFSSESLQAGEAGECTTLQLEESATVSQQLSSENKNRSLQGDSSIGVSSEYTSPSWQGAEVGDSATFQSEDSTAISRGLSSEDESRSLQGNTDSTMETSRQYTSESLQAEARESATLQSEDSTAVSRGLSSEDESRSLQGNTDSTMEASREYTSESWQAEASESATLQSEDSTVVSRGLSSEDESRSLQGNVDTTVEVSSQQFSSEDESRLLQDEAAAIVKAGGPYSSGIPQEEVAIESVSQSLQDAKSESPEWSSEDGRRSLQGDVNSTVMADNQYTSETWQGEAVSQSASLQESTPASQTQTSEDERRRLSAAADTTVEASRPYSSETWQEDRFDKSANPSQQQQSSAFEKYSSDDGRRSLEGGKSSTMEVPLSFTSESWQGEETTKSPTVYRQQQEQDGLDDGYGASNSEFRQVFLSDTCDPTVQAASAKDREGRSDSPGLGLFYPQQGEHDSWDDGYGANNSEFRQVFLSDTCDPTLQAASAKDRVGRSDSLGLASSYALTLPPPSSPQYSSADESRRTLRGGQEVILQVRAAEASYQGCGMTSSQSAQMVVPPKPPRQLSADGTWDGDQDDKPLINDDAAEDENDENQVDQENIDPSKMPLSSLFKTTKAKKNKKGKDKDGTDNVSVTSDDVTKSTAASELQANSSDGKTDLAVGKDTPAVLYTTENRDATIKKGEGPQLTLSAADGVAVEGQPIKADGALPPETGREKESLLRDHNPEGMICCTIL